jgi:hypothetical protein
MSCCSDNWVVPGANPAIPPPEPPPPVPPPQLVIDGNYNLVVTNDPIANTDTLSLNPLMFAESIIIPNGGNTGTFQFEPLGITLEPPYHVIPYLKDNYAAGIVPRVFMTQNTTNIEFTVTDAITGNPLNSGILIDFTVGAYLYTSLPLVPKTFTFSIFGPFTIGSGIYPVNVVTQQTEITSQIPNDYYFRNNRTGVKVTMSYAGLVFGADLFSQYQGFRAGLSKINNSLANQIAFKFVDGTAVAPTPLADWGTVIPNTEYVQVTNNVIFSENDQLWYSWAFTSAGVNSALTNLQMSLTIDYMGY